MKKNASLFVALCALLPVAGLADDCRCTMGRVYPDAFRVSPCNDKIEGRVWAEVTCDEPTTLEATEREWPITGPETPQHVTTTLTNKCSHGKSFSEPVTIPVEYDDSLPCSVCIPVIRSIHFKMSLGYTPARLMAGRLVLESSNPSPSIYSVSSLKLKNSRLDDFVSFDGVRQYLAPQCFVVAADNPTNGFDVLFYERSRAILDVPSVEGGDAVYRVAADAAPFRSYHFRNPDGPGVCSRLRIEQRTGGVLDESFEYRWSQGSWTLVEGDERFTSLVEDGAFKTETVSDGSGRIASKVRKEYKTVAGSSRVVSETDDPDGLARTTTFEYYETGALAGWMRRRVDPDGNWTEWNYLEDGRTTEVRSNVPSLGAVRTVRYSYSPVLPGGTEPYFLSDTGNDDPQTPRVETVFVGEVPLSKTLRRLVIDAEGYRTIEEVRLRDPAETNLVAAWFDPSNPRTLSQYMPETDFKPCSRLPVFVVGEDGTASLYQYSSGTFVPGESGLPGTFTPVMGGNVFQTTITHGTKDSFGFDENGYRSTDEGGIPFQTTREIKLETRADRQELQRETWVCSSTNGVYERIAWSTTTRDALGRVVATRSSDGSRTENEWLGDRLVASTGADGIRTTYAYDGLGRRVSSTYTDPLTGAEVVSSTTYDVAGRVLASATTAGGLSQSTQRRYDGAGRLVWSCGPDGIETTTSYGTTNGLHFVATTRGAGGLFTTSATYSYADGRTAYVERNGKRAETYEYGYADGLQWTIAYEGPKGTNSPVWTASVSDALGRTISELRPGFGGSILETAYAYNAAGQLLSSEEYTLSAEATPRTPRTPREILALRSLRENQTLRSRTLNLYDSLGTLRVSASDVNLNGVIDFAGPDIVSSNETTYAFLDSAWWQESSRYAFPDTGSSASLRVSTTRTRLSGLGVSETTELGAALLASETRAVDALGNVSSRKSYRNRAAHTAFNFSTSAASTLSAWSLSIGGHSVSNRTATGILSSRAYDALGRVVSMTDGRGNVSSYSYDESGRLASSTDATGATTAYGYDALGRRTGVTNALGLVTTTAYDLDGNVVSQRGAQYPVDYAFDDYGRMAAMSTYRSEDLSHADVTTWLYDEATGLMTNKVYADGRGPTYDYTADGKLSRRTLARGITTDYAYDSQGRLVSKNYSDSTPDVSLAYDRLGHTLSAICSGVSTNLYVYNRLGQLTNEVQNGTTIARSYDALGRATGYAIGNGEAAGSAVSYSYDPLGRFASVFSGTNVFSYSYLPGSDLVSGMAANTGHAWERIYESDRNLIATVHNHYGNRTISRFDYTNDEIGRRIARVDSGEAFSETAFERYSYNDRSEVIGSQRFYGSDIDDLSRPVTGRSFGYGYDSIGNRVSSFEDAGGERLTTTYTANELNQYTAIQNPGAVPLRGDAKRDAVVTVNGDRAERDNGTASFTPWSYALPSFNSNASFQHAAILAVAQSATGEDGEQRESGSVFVPAEETLLTYDDDGNMTFDGHFRYSWNGENRMIRVEEAVAPTNRAPTVITYAYDEQGRMVSKNIAGTNTVTRSLIWDGYNIVRETDNGVSTYNVWGLDLDGTVQGCGGVGGLLAVAKTNGLHVALYDANGNVSEYVAASGALSVHYEYSPFGEQFMSQCESFTHQFCTKPYCSNTAYLEFQLRNYAIEIARWTTRDPMEESAGASLFCAVNNNTVNQTDVLGLRLELAPPKFYVDEDLSETTWMPIYNTSYSISVKKKNTEEKRTAHGIEVEVSGVLEGDYALLSGAVTAKGRFSYTRTKTELTSISTTQNFNFTYEILREFGMVRRYRVLWDVYETKQSLGCVKDLCQNTCYQGDIQLEYVVDGKGGSIPYGHWRCARKESIRKDTTRFNDLPATPLNNFKLQINGKEIAGEQQDLDGLIDFAESSARQQATFWFSNLR